MISPAKTLALLAIMTGLCGFIGVELMNNTGGLVAIGIAVGSRLLVISGHRRSLRAHQGRPLADRDEPDLYALSRQLVHTAGIPPPKLFPTNCKQPNAFAVVHDPRTAASNKFAVTQYVSPRVQTIVSDQICPNLIRDASDRQIGGGMGTHGNMDKS